MTRRFELSGHRGARGLWPENTLAGFAGALRLGVDAIEFDVVLTADGVAVVSHDLSLNPDLVRGPDGRWLDAPGPAVASLTLAALQRLDVGRTRPGSATRLHPRQQPVDGQTLPTLAAVFRLAAGQAVRLEVELKAAPQRLAVLVIAEARSGGVEDQVTLRAFDWRGLHQAAVIAPGMPLCFLTETADGETWAAVRDAATAATADWAPPFEALTPETVAAAQAAGLRVKPWTVNRPEDMARMIAWGVDGFCTDAPDVAHMVMAGAGLELPPALAAA